MENLREELRMHMWSIYTRYNCARKVLTRHKDLQALPERQIRGAMQKIWCDWTFTGKKTPKEAYKTISRENARRMIETSDMIHEDPHEAYRTGRLTVNMEDVVRRLERLQRGETEEEEKSGWLTRRKQQIWEDQYLRHHGHITSQKVRYKATFILQETLGPRPETPLLDDIATPKQLKKLEEERKEKDDILEDWHIPPGSPWERSEDQTFDTTSLS